MRYVFAVIALCSIAATTNAAGLPAGDIVVSAKINSTDMGLIEINPISGDRTILSDNTHGTGMPFTFPVGVQVMSNGDLLVTDNGYNDKSEVPTGPNVVIGSPARLYVVDPTTGDRTVISQGAFTSYIAPDTSYPQIGSGPAFSEPGYVAQAGNQILVAADDSNVVFGQLMSVDPVTGNRTIVSGTGIGSGTTLSLLGGFATSGNTAFVAGNYQGLFKIDLTTGNRTLIAGAAEGTGAPLNEGFGVVGYGGQIYVAGGGPPYNLADYGVFRIDPTTGNRSIVSSGTVGSGPLGNQAAMALAIGSDGTILMTVGGPNSSIINGLLSIDPTTGNRTFLSDAAHGTGASFIYMEGLAVVPLMGDANGDGIVNGQDLALISSKWTQSGYFLSGDLNGDGIVNGQDLALVSSNWLGTSLGHGVSGSDNVPVPEPSAIIVAALGGLALLAMRRRR